jgi:parallel beta-helix repeat protein
MNKKMLSLIIVSLFLMMIFSAVSPHGLKTISSSLIYEDYTDTDGVIDIRSNYHFVNHPAVNCGDGSSDNPYIIENWRVKQIIIYNTTCYFEINNCFIYYTNGIKFNGVSNAKIQNCIIDYIVPNAFGARGIELFWSTGNEINNCTVIGYKNSLFFRSFAYNNIIENCEISDLGAESYGFCFQDSDNNIIKNCEISDLDAESYGFCFEESNNNVVKQSLIQGIGKYAIFLDIKSYGNTIYHNTIKNSGDHVNPLGWSLNNWDDGSEGNYWSNYKGKDEDGNGIGDTSYNQDNYPLIKPYGTPFPPSIRWSGGEKGMIWKAYDYFFKTKDPDNDMVYYIIDWGDKTPTETVGPYNSNEETPATDNIHIYRKTGTYNIRAKARDVDGDESDWSVTFPRTMSISRSNQFLVLNSFFEKIFEKIPFFINFYNY